MNCPYCGSEGTRVVDSRPSDGGLAIRRRRECAACGRRFTTYERPQLEPLMVNKRSGAQEAFNPDKLLRGLMLACEKRPVDPEALKRFAYRFEDQIDAPEISTEEIGKRAMAFLRELDEVAYIRFASVYREFDSVERFIEEIRRLERKAPES
ncbi:transcriptional regulator NrdR [Oceanithermus sp.]